MSLKRTKEIEKKMSELDGLKIYFEDLFNNRQSAYDNKSEKWQESEAGNSEIDNIYKLERIFNSLEECYDKVYNLF